MVSTTRLLALALLICLGGPVWASDTIVSATYDAPTDRYPHGALGDPVEFGALVLKLENGETRRIELPERRVFEDTAPRLADLDGDGEAEVVTVEADSRLGARLAVYGADGLIAATEPIGTRFRWLAPAGIGDLDGDGVPEIAYVDRPHLARVLRVVRLNGSRLEPVADLAGVTNHRFGDPRIEGGFRDCSIRPELVLANAEMTEIIAVRLEQGALTPRRIDHYTGPASLERALACAP